MSLEANEVRSFGTGHVYIGDVGATEPASMSDPVDLSEWTELGHLSDEGIKATFGKARTTAASWQSFPLPVRTLTAPAPSTVAFSLLQWNQDTISLALGGGEWTDDGAGDFTYEFPGQSEVNEKALIMEGEDDGTKYRFIFRKTENEAGVEFSWSGSSLSPLPIVMTLLAADGDLTPGVLQTNDENIELVGS